MAYTFDAGPNAVLFLEEKELNRFASLFYSVFSSTSHEEFFRGKAPVPSEDFVSDLASFVPDNSLKGQVQYTIVTSLGQGPKNVDPTG